jgi:hypothetical protein
MNNIYVDELPKSCDECPCCNSDIDYGACCNLGAYGFKECYCTNKKHPNCQLKPLTDRLAEERKKAVQEIKQKLAEKEKERHEEWLSAKEWKWECDRLKKELHTANQETLHFQNKYFAENQKAIAELEKVKEFVTKKHQYKLQLKEQGNLTEYGEGSALMCEILLDKLDQQIKSLKGETNEQKA